MKTMLLFVIALSLASVRSQAAEAIANPSASDRLVAVIDSMTTIPDFKPEPRVLDAAGLPMVPPGYYQYRADRETFYQCQSEASQAKDLMPHFAFVVRLHARVAGRLEANERDAALPSKPPNLSRELMGKMHVIVSGMSAEGIKDPAVRKEYQAFLDEGDRYREYSRWQHRLREMRDVMRLGFELIADAAYDQKPKSVEILLRDLAAAGAERKLVLPIIEALQKKGRLKEF